MKLTRLGASAAAACAAAALTIGVATPALADTEPAEPDANAIAASAQAAADAANQAFIDGDWDAVLANADAFDSASGELTALRDAAAADLAALETGALAAALAAYEQSQTDHRTAQVARNQAKSAADAQQEVKNAARVARNKAVRAKREAEAALTAAQDAVPGFETALAEAQTALSNAEAAEQAAIDAFHTPLAELIGIPAAWYGWNDRPVLVSDLSGAYADAVAERDRRQQAVEDARAAHQAATGFDRIGTAIALELAKGARDIAQAWVDSVDSVVVSVGGHAKEQAVADAAIATQAARDALANAEAALDAANTAVIDAQATLDAAIIDHEIKGQANKDAKVELDRLRALQSEAQQALFDAKDVRAEKKAIYEALLAEQGAAADKVDELNALIEGLAGAKQDVADRRADLADYRKAEQEVVWATDSAPGVAQPGDTVTVDFTIPGSSDYDLSGVSVAVVSPAGLVPACDVPADGTVPAGSVVACTVEYQVTEDDVASGTVTLEVTLSGFLPLGPGNPRSFAVNKAQITASHSLSFDVEALPVIEDVTVPEEVEEPADEPSAEPSAETTSNVVTETDDAPADEESSADASDDEAAATTDATLPTTGGDANLMLPAGVLVALGAGLLLARRFMSV